MIHPLKSDKAHVVQEHLRDSWPLEVRVKVEFMAVDNPSQRYWKLMLLIFPSLKVMVLDTVHLPITYEFAYWRKRTAGSKKLRGLMCKFCVKDPNRNATEWGPVYTGDVFAPASSEEERVRYQIFNCSMPQRTATNILRNIDYAKPWNSRLEFVQAVAALSCVYKDEMNKVAPGPNRKVKELLYTGCSPDRCEWYMNNIRMRHMMSAGDVSLLPSGTSSNEALHYEINSWFRQTQVIHESTVLLKFRIMVLAKQTPHVNALFFPTIRQLPSCVVASRSLSKPLWTRREWNTWCDQLSENKKGKAVLPLNIMRKESQIELAQTCDAFRKRPARSDNRNFKRKRTPFTLRRQGSLVLGGVKRKPSSAIYNRMPINTKLKRNQDSVGWYLKLLIL